jgi:TRAP-type C4-dicarboxylate transport system permease small subunit
VGLSPPIFRINMINFIKFAHNLSKLSGVTATLLVIAAVFVTTEMVIVRYFLNMSTTWQTEFVIFSLAAATFVGSPYVLLKKKHVSIDIVTHYMSKKNQKLMSYLASFLSIIFLIIFFYTSLELFIHAWEKNLKTPTIWNFPLWKVYIFLPIGAFLLIIQSIADIFCTMIDYYNPKGN